MTTEQAIFNLLGIAASARQIVSGEEQVVKEVRTNKAKLVIVSNDASQNTTKKMHDKCAFYNVPIYTFGSREQLGHATGRESRVSLAIMDNGFAKKLSQYFNELA
ncbi:YlxQ family RNA-binding protein [Kurthia senegalensis]|uniref:YlxQ family RNA-binding protein n=1 Tax=Kurthia senegalensis TaxID=1033740 RepID=UPI00028973AE|nr:YlxQ family RNA-binding protein [Kurthia senegalensis]